MTIVPYYDRKGITIYNCKVEDVLPQLTAVDLLLTDPPYGLGEAAGKNKSRSHAHKKGGKLIVAKDYGVAEWDNKPPDTATLDTLRALAIHQIIFGGNYFHLPPTSCWLVWDKLNSGDFADCELAWTNLKKAVRKFAWRWNGMIREEPEVRHHPTQKPLAVMRWCLGQAPKGITTVLDPYMGSGTTIVAAKLAGLQAVGIEQERKYCDIAITRLGGAVAKETQIGFGL